MNAISPGVYTKITTLESYVEEVPSSVGFVAIISDKSRDNVLQYSSSREHFLKTTGNPNVNRYGRIWAHGSLIGERFTAASPNLYWIRVMPNDATYANLAWFIVRRKRTKIWDADPSAGVWQEKTFLGKAKPQLVKVHETGGEIDSYMCQPEYEGFVVPLKNLVDINTLEELLDEEKNKLLFPVYVQGEKDGILYTFKVFSDNLVLVSTSDVEVEPVFVKDTDNKYQLTVQFLEEGDTGYDSAYVVPGQTFRVKLSLRDMGTLIGDEEIPPVVVMDFQQENAYQIQVSSGEVVFNPVNLDDIIDDIYDVIVPLFVIHSEGRGSWYNNVIVGFNVIGNKDGIYDLSLYEIDENGNLKSVGAPSYHVSLDPTKVDESGESVFIKEVLNRYVAYIDVYIDEDNMDNVFHQFRLDIANNLLTAEDVTPYRKASGLYVVTKVVGTDDDLKDVPEGSYIYVRDNATGKLFNKDGKICQYVGGNVTDIEGPISNGSLIYDGDKTYLHLGYGKVTEFSPYVRFLTLPWNDNDDPDSRQLGQGGDGSLFDTTTQTVNADVATNLLAQAYKGLIDNNVLNTEFYWFDLVFCGGYPKDVKDAAVELAMVRRDCITLLDLDDNYTPEQAVQARLEKYPYNTEFAAIYEPWIKVRDVFSGRDLWVSPIYVLAFLIGTNDRVSEVWYATAGIPQGVAQNIKESRYSPNLSERDRFYLNQINPIVKFRDGYVVWGQLTTLREPTPLQDINIMRCVLYIKRALENYFRYVIFKLNDELTWAAAEEGASVFVRDVASRRGLYDFKLKVWADEYMKKRKAARATLIIEPVRVLEKLYFDINVK